MLLTDPGWTSEFEQAIAADGEVRLETRHAQFNCLLEIGDDQYLLEVDRGSVRLTPEPTTASPWDFAVRGSADAWRRYAGGDSDSEYRDPLGMWFQGVMTVTGNIKSHIVMEGNYQKLFANLEPLYAILSQLREAKEV